MLHRQMPVLLALSLMLFWCRPAAAQHLWQQPSPRPSAAEMAAILGPQEREAPTRPLRILLSWSIDEDHDDGYHEYQRVRDLLGELLGSVPDVQVDSVYGFPQADHWKWADLVVFYLHLDFLEAPDYDLMDAYLARGGGIVAVHEAVIQRPTGHALAQRWGLAWNDERSLWGIIPTPVTLDTTHAIMRGLPRQLHVVDEFYWDLTGHLVDIDILGTAPGGPAFDSDGPATLGDLDGNQWPVFWTVQNSPGRVFVSLVGHNEFTFYDPYFRTILFRGMAWALDEPFDPFKPLVMKR